MKINELQTYKKILIVGYGIEGKSTEKFLRKYHPEALLTIVDHTDGEDYLANQESFDLAIKTPSISPKDITIPYTTQTNIFFANTSQKKIGITGSKGKSSTAALLHTVFIQAGISAKLLGNIGYPMLDYFLGEMNEDDVFIVELSSYQLEDIQYSPHIACFLNIYADHISHHGSVQAYFTAKSNIVKYCSENDYFIYNGAFSEIMQLAHTTKAQGIDFSISHNEKLPTHRQLNRDTVRATHEIARLLSIPDDIFESAIQSFSGLPHRLQKVGEFNGITFINDSSATTPEAAIFAITQLPRIDTMLIGGLDRQLDINALIKIAVEKNIKHYVLFPDTQEKIKHQLLQAGVPESAVYFAQDMSKAVDFCYRNNVAGDICLLSPGFASYNQYTHFPARGDDFVYEVRLQGSK